MSDLKPGEYSQIELTTPPEEGLSFMDALLGLLIEPRQTVAMLFAAPRPLYVPGFLLSLAVVVFLPIIAQLLLWDFLETRVIAIASLALVLFLTSVIFVLLEYFFLMAFGGLTSPREILTAFAYSCAPLFPIVLCYYLFDLVRVGRLAIVTFIITGVAPHDNLSVALFPYAHLLAKVSFLIVFYHSMRALRREGPVTTLAIVLLSSIPFYMAFALAMLIANVCLPGSVRGIADFLWSFAEG